MSYTLDLYYPFTLDGIPASTFLAKGDIIIGTGSGYSIYSPTESGATVGQVLTYDPAEPTGWKVATVAGGPGGSVDSVNGASGVVVLDTDNIDEGATNLYWTTARADTWLTGKSTTDLSEGTNLYWTNARFDTRLGTSSVTDLSDVTNVGSGIIISAAERTAIGTATTHIADTANPHSVTAAQVGADATGTAASAVSTHESTYNHDNYNTAYTHSQVSSGNPHSVTAADIGVEAGADVTDATNVIAALAANTADVALNSQNITGAGTINSVTMSEVVVSTAVDDMVSISQATYDGLGPGRPAGRFYLVTS